MNRHNRNFFNATRHWDRSELSRYIVAAAELLDAQEGELDAERRAELLIQYEADLAPLIIWQEDNIRQEIVHSIAAWAGRAAAPLVTAYQSLAETLPIHILNVALRLLVNADFRGGERLAFAVAARRARDYNRVEGRTLGVILTYLAGLEGGGSSAMTMAENLKNLGLSGSRFAEAAARMCADESPSLLASALDALDQSWKQSGVEREEVNGFLDDLALRVDQATLLRAFDKMRAPRDGPLLCDALRLFTALDWNGGWSDATLADFASSNPPEVLLKLMKAQGRLQPRVTQRPSSDMPLSLEIYRAAHRINKTVGNA